MAETGDDSRTPNAMPQCVAPIPRSHNPSASAPAPAVLKVRLWRYPFPQWVVVGACWCIPIDTSYIRMWTDRTLLVHQLIHSYIQTYMLIQTSAHPSRHAHTYIYPQTDVQTLLVHELEQTIHRQSASTILIRTDPYMQSIYHVATVHDAYRPHGAQDVQDRPSHAPTAAAKLQSSYSQQK